ncbi:MAG: Asp-tRNA(Asn)/Glu-tRNA(Gln) amidotransferase subunit GatB [Candidatus Brennerbacteria bacterium]|nr:Asp-tRNA(Asn)/Glu-tRNA(Gln) amidotransferase subunit GatB [Candidatus Brennerbacteria bacterium]
MSEYKPTIGLEIHAELKTNTKMFCGCLNDPEEKHPNVNVCPICLAHPGTLPVINRQAVEAVIKLGYAVGGIIPKTSHFDRKSYFYPDLPKGYQISQYENPLVEGGSLLGVRIKRVHLEEDTGRLIHSSPSTGSGRPASLVDFNRAGIPLMELVTEPDIKNAEQAVKFAKELQLILRYLGISDADMEKGQMRVEANISVSDSGDMGVKVEVKNINSFKAVKDAIDYEINRQKQVIEAGDPEGSRQGGTYGAGKIIQETRGWDDVKRITKSQRTKESAHDYRYFPEPDLPPLEFSDAVLEKIKLELPELPEAKRIRFMKEFGFNREQAETIIADRFAAQYFESAVSELLEFQPELTPFSLLYNYFTSDLWGLMAQKGIGFGDLKIPPEHLAHLVSLIADETFSSRMAKDVLAKMFDSGLDPEAIIKESGLTQMGDEEDLTAIIEEVIKENLPAVEDVKKGKQNAVQFLIGQAMKKSKGRAKPEAVKKLLDRHIKTL